MFQLALLTLAISASVGPTKLVAIQEGLRKGASATFFITFGAVLADLIYANLAGLGLSKIGENFYFETTFLFISALVFVYLGVKGLKTPSIKNLKETVKPKYQTHPLFLGILITLINPLTIIFWPGAVASLDIGYQPLIFLIIIPLVGGLWSLFEALVVHFGRKFIKEKLFRIVEIITSVILLGFSIQFVIQAITLLRETKLF